MKIKSLVSIAAATWSLYPGQVAEIPTDEAERLLRAGYAERVSGDPERAQHVVNSESATVEPSTRARKGKKQ